MRWPWYRERTVPSEEAACAAEQARRSLIDATNFEAKAARMSRELERTLRANHFGAAVRQAMRGE